MKSCASALCRRPRITRRGGSGFPVRGVDAAVSCALLLMLCACTRPTNPEPAAPWFRDIAADTGIRFTHVNGARGQFYMAEIMGSGCALLDYDNDGDLDVFLIQGATGVAGNRLFRGELDYCTPKAYRALPAHLFHNEHGRFVDVTARSGLTRAAGPGLGVVAFDANGDGWPDLFVANDSSANHLWINGRDGTFTERALQSGVAYGEDGLAKAGMGVALGDYDNDGDEDLMVLNLLRE